MSRPPPNPFDQKAFQAWQKTLSAVERDLESDVETWAQAGMEREELEMWVDLEKDGLVEDLTKEVFTPAQVCQKCGKNKATFVHRACGHVSVCNFCSLMERKCRKCARNTSK